MLEKEDMDVRGNVRTKVMCEEGEEGKDIELEENTTVSDAGIKCLKSGLFLGQMKNCDKYLYVRQCDECEVKYY
jgi:hypothetical protein